MFPIKEDRRKNHDAYVFKTNAGRSESDSSSKSHQQSNDN